MHIYNMIALLHFFGFAWSQILTYLFVIFLLAIIGYYIHKIIISNRISDKKWQQKLNDITGLLNNEQQRQKDFIRHLQIYESSEKMMNYGGWYWDLTTDPDHIIYTKNFANIFDIDVDKSITARDLIAVIHVDDRIKINQALSEAMHYNKSYKLDYRIVRRNDRNDLVECIGVPILNENDKIIGIKGVIILIKENVD